MTANVRYCFVCGSPDICEHREEGLLPQSEREKRAADLLAKLTGYTHPEPEPVGKDILAKEVLAQMQRAAAAKVGPHRWKKIVGKAAS